MAAGKPQSRATGSRDHVLTLSVCFGLAILVFATFGQTLQNGFVNYDDGDYFFSNSHVQAGITWRGVVWAFQTVCATNWHPLTWLSLMLDAALFGPGAAGPHFTNTVLHAANAVLLFLLLKRLMELGRGGDLPGMLWPCAIVAAIFAVHPLRVESVAWIAERKDVLSGLFFMLALLMYARYVEWTNQGSTRRWTAYGLSLLYFALGLMSKPMLVTLPFVLLLLDWWPLKRLAGPAILRRVVEKVPFLLLSTISSMITLHVQKQAEISAQWLPLSERIENAAIAYVAYLGQLVYPAKLAVIYPYPTVTAIKWGAAVTVLIGLTIAAFVMRKRSPYLLTGWLWFLGMLVPVIGVVQVGYQARADRYTYLPAIGLVFALVWMVRDLSLSWPARRQVLGVSAGAVIIALMTVAMVQVTYWRSNLALWQRAVDSTSFNPIALVNLDVALGDSLPPGQAMQDMKRVLADMPDYVEAHYDLGTLLYRSKQYDEAAVELQRACQLKPDRAAAWNNLANVRLAQGRVDEAAELYQKTIELDPDYWEAHLNLALIQEKQGHLDAAAEQCRLAAGLNPGIARPRLELANLLVAQGKLDEAVDQYQKVLELKPDDVETHYNLAVASGRLGRLEVAEQHFRKVTELDPDYADAHGNLAKLLAQEGKLTEAVAEFRRTVELAPNSAQVHFRFGEALQAQRNDADAVNEYEKALQLDPRHPVANLDLAWLRATCPEATLRNGAEAVPLAQAAQRLAGNTAQVLDTLAAADAEAGHFAEAVETAKAALAMSTNNPQMTDAIQARLRLYENGTAYHEKPQ